MGHGRAKAGVSGGLGCARPGHGRPAGGQSSERLGALEAHQQAMNPSQARPRIERARPPPARRRRGGAHGHGGPDQVVGGRGARPPGPGGGGGGEPPRKEIVSTYI